MQDKDKPNYALEENGTVGGSEKPIATWSQKDQLEKSRHRPLSVSLYRVVLADAAIGRPIDGQSRTKTSPFNFVGPCAPRAPRSKSPSANALPRSALDVNAPLCRSTTGSDISCCNDLRRLQLGYGECEGWELSGPSWFVRPQVRVVCVRDGWCRGEADMGFL